MQTLSWKSRLRRFLRKFTQAQAHKAPLPDLRDIPTSGEADYLKRKAAFLGIQQPRILYSINRRGGVGGLQRSTLSLVRSFLAAGCQVDLVCEDISLPGPYRLEAAPGLRIQSIQDFKKTRNPFSVDLFYCQPTPGFQASFWNERLSSSSALRILNWQREAPAVLKAQPFDFDLLHAESLPPGQLYYSNFLSPTVYQPLAETEIPPQGLPAVSYYLTVFNPYARIKGLTLMQDSLDYLDKPLVWCHDLHSLSGNPEKLQKAKERIERFQHPKLIALDSPSQETLAYLYRNCEGYLCFSEYESYGWAIRDAVHYGKPVAAKQVGILREAAGFRPWKGRSQPVFNMISGGGPPASFLQDLRLHLLTPCRHHGFRYQAEPFVR